MSGIISILPDGKLSEPLEKADICFSQGLSAGGLFSFITTKAILMVTRRLFEPKSKASHQFMVIKGGDDPRKIVIRQQTSPKIGNAKLSEFMRPGVKLWVFRDRSLSNLEKDLLVDKAKRTKGVYGFGKIITFFIGGFIGKLISILLLPISLLLMLLKHKPISVEMNIVHLLNITKTIVCSQFIAKLWWELDNQSGVGRHFGRHWLNVDPDQAMDFCEKYSYRFPLMLYHYAPKK